MRTKASSSRFEAADPALQPSRPRLIESRQNAAPLVCAIDSIAPLKPAKAFRIPIPTLSPSPPALALGDLALPRLFRKAAASSNRYSTRALGETRVSYSSAITALRSPKI